MGPLLTALAVAFIALGQVFLDHGRLMLKIRSDAGEQLKVCHHTGVLVPIDPLSPSIPGRGRHLTVVVESNWAGVVAERLEFDQHRNAVAR